MTGSAMPTDDEFREIIYGHYHESARGMPWRETDDPYHILVSEIMLQQTQVERVRSAYERFLARFPDIRTLAEAPLADVLALWQGLGYNRRARLLHACAGRIVRERGGKVPESFDELVDLPGIGPSTAGGLMAFAFRTGVPFIETNIRRVYLHFFFPDREGVPDSELLPVIERTLDRRDPRSWYYALMDYGVMLKKTEENANRRSRTYKKQSRFEGSNRQIRGAAIRALTNGAVDGLSELELRTAMANEGIDATAERLRSALRELEAEGLLVKVDWRWRVA